MGILDTLPRLSEDFLSSSTIDPTLKNQVLNRWGDNNTVLTSGNQQTAKQNQVQTQSTQQGGFSNLINGIGNWTNEHPALTRGLIGAVFNGLINEDPRAALAGGIVHYYKERENQQNLQIQGFQDQIKLNELLQKQKEEKNKRSEYETNTAASLRKELEDKQEIKAFAIINGEHARLSTVYNDYLKNPNKRSLNVLDQALINTYNKILDPNSVVRESEYARSPEGLSLIDRVDAIYNKLKSGGGGLTDNERAEFYRATTKMTIAQKGLAEQQQKFYKDEAVRSGISPDRVIRPFQEISANLNAKPKYTSADNKNIGKTIEKNYGGKTFILPTE